MSVDAEDRDLAARFLDGDLAASRTVDDWLAAAASPYRRKLRAEWDDLLQDLRLELMRLLRTGAFRGESSFRTYLWRVVGHSCLDRLRAQARRPVPVLEFDEPRTTDPSPLDQTLSREAHALLLRVLEAMPADCRQLWGLILAGQGYDEIGRTIGVRPETLRVRALRCRQRAVEERQRLLA